MYLLFITEAKLYTVVIKCMHVKPDNETYLYSIMITAYTVVSRKWVHYGLTSHPPRLPRFPAKV